MKGYKIANLLASILFLIISFAAISHQALAVSQFLSDEVKVTHEEAMTALPGVNQKQANEAKKVAKSEKVVAKNAALAEPKIARKNVSSDNTAAARKTVLRPVVKPVVPKPRPTPCAGYYARVTIGGRTICLRSTGSTGGALSYSNGYIYNNGTHQSWNQYIFAHNSAGLFGGLKNLSVGTRFSMTVGGKTRQYRISAKANYCDYSNYADGTAGCAKAYPRSPVLDMWDVVNPGRRGADLALMTCAGKMLAGGDASHRLVVFAQEI